MEKEVSVCDACGKEAQYYLRKCVGCGIVYCEKCANLYGIGYNRRVLLCSTRNIYFCTSCDLHPPDQVKELHAVCRYAKALSIEYDTWHQKFTIPSEKVNTRLGLLIEDIEEK